MSSQNLQQSQVIHGCMRMANLAVTDAASLISTALDQGISFFDHADIYGGGRSEEIFGQALRAAQIPRQRVIIQSKCGIRPGLYDFSKKHILSSVEGILNRLGTDYLDILLLHRPDTLVEPEEVAEAFSELEQSGKVRHFGVSNQNPYQVELLQTYCSQKLLFNQLQFSLVHSGMVDAGINVNLNNARAIDRDGGILEYSRLKGMAIQAWSPLQHGFIEGVFLENPAFAALNHKLAAMAQEKGITSAALAIAWILRHPAKMQPIVGTTNPKRLAEISKASEVTLSRAEWYELYRAAGHQLP